MKNHYCDDPWCIARVEEKGELCEECKKEKEMKYEREINRRI